MEATGVFWRPVFREMEGRMRVMVANPAHVKAIRGRKTDRKDAAWLAGKVQEDSLPGSFIPAPEVREGREWARLHTNLVRARTQARNQTLKLLLGAGIPLSAVLSDVFGASGMGLLEALATGRTAWEELEGKLRGRARLKASQIQLALEVCLRDGEREQLSFQLQRLKTLDEQVAEVDRHLREWSDAYRAKRILLTTIPGIGELAAQLILAEVGPDLTAFPSAKHFAAWLGLAPASHETGGKSRPAGTRKGNHRLQSLLVECAQATARTKGCSLRGKYLGLKARMPAQKAIVAIAHKLALIIYRVLMDEVPYQEKETDTPPSPHRARLLRQAIRLIQDLGGTVHMSPSSNT
jgi:transposase